MKKKILLLLLFIGGLPGLNAQNIVRFIIDDDIQLVHIVDSVYMHVTWETSEKFGRFSSNGLIYVKNGQAIMIDTPVSNKKTKKLIEFLKDSLNVTISKLIIGHYHSDCLGGLEYIQSIEVESIANKLTIDKCKELNLSIPSSSFEDSLVFNFNGVKVECRFFGGGHTYDNIVVWLPEKKILFGGCLIKSMRSRGLGNLTDAVVEDWEQTVQKILDSYADIRVVIPGHGALGGEELLTHTIDLVQEEKNKTF